MSQRPFVESKKIYDLLIEIYGKKALHYTELASFADRNFKVAIKDSDGSTEWYILKIINFEESQNQNLQFKIDEVQAVLKKRGFRCTSSVPDLNSRYFSYHPFPSITAAGPINQCVVRLLKFKKGRPLGADKSLLTSSVITELGSLLALFHCALQDLPSDCLQVDPNNKWALENPRQVLLYFTSNTEIILKQQISRTITTFADKLDVLRDSLRKGIIHGDFHEMNIIIDWSINNNDFDSSNLNLPEKKPKVSINDILKKYAIIDFNEISYSFPILDVGRLICEMMRVQIQKSPTSTYLDLVIIATHVLSGYYQFKQLSKSEFELLYWVIAFGFCQMVVLKQYKAMLDPTNSYAMAGIDEHTRLLQMWLKKTDTETTELFHQYLTSDSEGKHV